MHTEPVFQAEQHRADLKEAIVQLELGLGKRNLGHAYHTAESVI